VIKSKNFILRLISSFFLLMIFLNMISGDLTIFISIVQISLFFSLWEFLRLCRFKESDPPRKIINNNFLLTRMKIRKFDYFTIFFICVLNLIFFYKILSIEFFLLVVFLFLLFLAIRYTKTVVIGLIYLSMPFFFINYYKLNYDFTLFFCFVIFFTIFSDIGAYFFGNLIGGKKLLEKVSPKKTISGAVGGIVFPLLFCFLFFNNLVSPWILVLYCFVFSFFVQSGDLLESYFKRRCFVKDSSNLIPGHGGILDRLDGIFLLLISVSILNILGFNFFFII
tara:strand:+ start:193 stop:1032 length:840 start_codon:yes stop_codon:yes gene_type:complete